MEKKTILILVDELEMKGLEKITSENMSIGFINLKTRSPYGEEELFLTINTGRKLSRKEFKRLDKSLDYLGDLLTTSSIGAKNENLIIGNREGKVNFQEKLIVYDYNWLIKTTNSFLEKTDLLLISFDIRNSDYRYSLLNQYISSNKDAQIIILPRKVANLDSNWLNKYLVPLLYFSNENNGLLTSNSSKREGFIVLEDISVVIKKTYGIVNKTDIGNAFGITKTKGLVKEFNNIYKETLNLLIIAYINHGLIYLGQALILISFFIRRIQHLSHCIYLLLTSNILISLILGFFQFHRNILVYLIISLILSILITYFILKDKGKGITNLNLSIYFLIVIGTILYPNLIYSSYLGFNNLIYGARYYGLNNGIMGVLLITSLLIYFKFKKYTFFLFPLNIIALSTSFGSNTGGFITSVISLGLIMYIYIFPKINEKKRLIILVLGGIALFSFNIFIDYLIGGRTHAIELFFRMTSFGLNELTTIVRFKLRELIKLSLLPPFSMVVITQVLVLNKLKYIYKENKELKKEVIIATITSSMGFLLNDTGVIAFIYMLHFVILHLTADVYNFD